MTQSSTLAVVPHLACLVCFAVSERLTSVKSVVSFGSSQCYQPIRGSYHHDEAIRSGLRVRRVRRTSSYRYVVLSTSTRISRLNALPRTSFNSWINYPRTPAIFFTEGDIDSGLSTISFDTPSVSENTFHSAGYFSPSG
ncbi:hypothetical protein C2E23DRAFT_558952 [Lenzites betulinus]|nr:hypothetical protein C2E23DRAFT_558952 [Lenzites betulinus]